MLRKFSDLRKFQRDPLNFFLSRGQASEQPLARLNMGFHPVYLVTDIDMAREVLRSDEDLIDKGRLIYKMREVIGQSSLTLSGEEHRQRRATIHNHLIDGLSGDYVPQISAEIRRFIATFSRGDIIKAPPATALLAMRVICSILFGRGALSPKDEETIVKAVHLVEDDLAAEIFRALPHTPWSYLRKKLKLSRARKMMTRVVEKTTRDIHDNSLIATFKNAGMTGKDLEDEILLMILAGHHTTGTAATWLLYHLALDKEAARSIAHESIALLDNAGELTPQKIKNAQISRNFVQEILRLYPSSYWMSRETKKDMRLGDYDLAKGTSLIISPWHFHRDPKYWPDPENLDITRDYKQKAFIPFGYGGRSCIGLALAVLELQLIALEFCVAFDIEVVSKVPADPPKPSVTIVPSDIRLRFIPKGLT